MWIGCRIGPSRLQGSGLVTGTDFGMAEDQYPENESMRVSHETIYRSLFIQARGAEERAD
jgi:hypothetical protein